MGLLYEAGRQQVIAKFGIDLDRDPVYFLAPEKAAEVLEIVYRPVYDQKAIDDARGGIAPSSRGSSVDGDDMEVAAIFEKTRATVEEDKRRQETWALLRGYVLRRESERASQTDPNSRAEFCRWAWLCYFSGGGAADTRVGGHSRTFPRAIRGSADGARYGTPIHNYVTRWW